MRSVKKIYWVAWAFYSDANLSSNNRSPALQQIERSPNGAVATWDADAEEWQKTYHRSGWRIWSGKSSSYTASVDSNSIFKQKIKFANRSQAFANHRKHGETKVPCIALLHGFIDPLKNVAPPPQNYWNPNTTTWRSANDRVYLCESMRCISMKFFWSHTLRVDLVAGYIFRFCFKSRYYNEIAMCSPCIHIRAECARPAYTFFAVSRRDLNQHLSHRPLS